MLVFLTLNMSRSFGSFGGLFLKLGRNLKTSQRRAKKTKIWTSLGVWRMHVGIFDLEHVI